jgi:hypothetical protein
LELPDPAVGACLIAGFRALRSLGVATAAKLAIMPPRHWPELRALERAKLGA